MEQITEILRSAAGTDVFAAGLALGALGTGLALASRMVRRLAALIWNRVTLTITVDSRTSAHGHLSLWLEREGHLARARALKLTPVREGRSGRERSVYLPDERPVWFTAQGHIVRLHTSAESSQIGPAHDRRPLEKLTVTLLGPRPSVVKEWIAEGRAIVEKAVWKGPTIRVSRDGYWDSYGHVRPRALETVLTGDTTPERLLADLTRFHAREEWYVERGVPWRRGYLLYGPPGTGKSSLIRALASELKRDLALINLAAKRLDDDGLREALASAPSNAFLVMEDIDAAFQARDAQEGEQGITFSGLLNAIDGIAAQEGRALFMTTNHREVLDPALIRPGRADVEAHLGHVDGAVARAMYLRFFPGEVVRAQAFGESLAGGTASPAVLQARLLTEAEALDTMEATQATQPSLLAAE